MVDSHTKGNGTSFGSVCHSIVADPEKTKPWLTEDDFCDSLFMTHSKLENPDSRIKEIFCLCILESWDLELGKRLKDIRIRIRIRNPGSTDKESGIQYLESRAQDCLGFLYMGRL